METSPTARTTEVELPDTLRAQRQRIDKWIWFARFARTRPLAVALIEDGYVRLNGVRVDDHAHGVKRGDVLTLSLARIVIVVKIVNFAPRRGPAAEASALYEAVNGD